MQPRYTSISKCGSIVSVVIFLFFTAVLFSGCTKKFESYNTNNNQLNNIQSVVLTPTALNNMENAIFGLGDGYQTQQNLGPDLWCGYATSTDFNNKQENTLFYNLTPWSGNSWGNAYTNELAYMKKMLQSDILTSAPEVYAVGLIIKVEAIDRLTDKFGPLPYSKAGSVLINTPYDDQQTIYTTFFSQLDSALNLLNTFLSLPAQQQINRLGPSDIMLSGNYKQWVKFANSLRLRLAMHISKVDPATAKSQGEKALSDPGGLLTTPGYLTGDDVALNGYTTLNLIVRGYSKDCQINATIATYLTGYNDPRTTVYMLPADTADAGGGRAPASVVGKMVGERVGINVSNAVGQYYGLSDYNWNVSGVAAATYMYAMTAAEVWFLKAEAALRGWNGAGNASDDYNMGIQTSMKQWGVDTMATGGAAVINNYMNDGTSTQSNYVDPITPAYSIDAMSTITVKWDDGASKEQMLERIITQKWLAMFPEGMEAWTEYRRTGYPKIFPIAINQSNAGNGGPISTDVQIRRIPYLSTGEYQTDPVSVADAVKNFLGGADNGGTRLWWDTGGSNF